MQLSLKIFLPLVFTFLGTVTAQEITSAQAVQTEINAPQDATYTVKPGDTLWDLAFRFLADPFKWPLIWNHNPYIKNPDLIYPGDPIRIPGIDERYSGNSGEIPGDAAPAMISQTIGALQESSAIKTGFSENNGSVTDSLIISAIRQRHKLSAAFFSTIPFLWSETDAAGFLYPGTATVDKPKDRESYQRFDHISITPQKEAEYKEGDTVDIFQPIRFVRFKNSVSNLIKRTGRARVIMVEPKRITAELFEMSDAIKGKERIALSRPSFSQDIDTLIEPEVVIGAEVFTRVEVTDQVYPFQTLILDRGESDGVKLGDVFAVYHRETPADVPSLAGTGYVAHVNKISCSMVIVNMTSNKLNAGDKAALIRRTRFSGDLDG
ncbi:MAG: LysM peptidoglycan-binding domain-containing protein [Fibrobacter sp.]|nr:LysM peptidoglycan-binding domain-containing protein [Fibrobacter sp.]